MELTSNTILVTGGGAGIGLALAERWLAAGNEVIICGRREDKLREAQLAHPRLHIHTCDVSKAAERVALRVWLQKKFPEFNVLVNNAGIQRRIQLAESTAGDDWGSTQQEIAINLEAPIHLTQLFLPHLLAQPRAAVVNVGSGLAFSPLSFVPVYCATKAALHSFTLSLRHQLASTPVRVIEIIPPAVNTDLGGPGLHTFGVPLNEFADAVFQRLGTDEVEIAYGTSEQACRASRAELDVIFQRMNSR